MEILFVKLPKKGGGFGKTVDQLPIHWQSIPNYIQSSPCIIKKYEGFL